jgi:hypothetical protein
VESDSDTESVDSRTSTRNPNKRKRQDDGEESDADGQRRGGGSTLKEVNAASAVTNANGADTNDPVAHDPPTDLNGDEDAEIRREQNVVENAERQEEADELSSDDELARELERELENGSGDDEEGFMSPAATGRGDDAEPSRVNRSTGDDEDELMGVRGKARGSEE